MAQEIGFWVMIAGFFLLFYFHIRTRIKLRNAEYFIQEIAKPWPNYVENAFAHILAGSFQYDDAVAFHCSNKRSLKTHTEDLRRGAERYRIKFRELMKTAQKCNIDINEERIETLARQKSERRKETERASIIVRSA